MVRLSISVTRGY